MKLVDASLKYLKRLSLPAKLWWGSGVVTLLGVALTGSDTCFGVLFTLLLVGWAVPTSLWAFVWVWGKITYRISVRLFLSYLLIGVLPFLLILVLLTFAAYVLAGQYASADFGDVVLRVRGELVRFSQDALDAAERDGPAAAREVLLRGPRWPEDLRRIAGHVDWIFASNGDVVRSQGASLLPVPRWSDKELDSGPFWHGEHQMLAAVARRGDVIAAAMIRLTDEAAKRLSEDQWYEVYFSAGNDSAGNDSAGNDSAGNDSGEIVPPADEPAEVRTEEEAGEEPAERRGSVDSQSSEGAGFWSGMWNNRWIFFVRVGSEERLWKDGRTLDDDNFTTFIKTSPREAATDLFRVPAEVRKVLRVAFLAACASFLFIYVGAVSFAIYYILVITRATSRLTKGARQVQAGHLDYRIPVKRRDQLGDLAVAFNQMTESVGSMLDEVAEKERLKNELELAREIQQRLLPGRELRHGTIVVHAYFRPAAEVGGDYFDLFPLERGHLIVAVGDVAGHGLPTGLLMAMVKAAVATLIQEGHRGVEILQRVNHFMLQQPRGHRMVTLAIADINVREGVAEITNAAHPPVYLSGSTVREVMLPALPVGYQWRKPPPTERLELEPGSRLIFYSDGLVEAVDEEGEQLGYERLKAFLEKHAELASEELLALLLTELEEHTKGRPLDDDLTLLVIDCGVEDEAEGDPR